MSKPFAWSFSALESFETCPRRHYLTRIAKLVDEPETDAMAWGKQVHKAFENYMKTGQPFSHTMAQFESVGTFFKKIADTSDEILTEQQWAIDEEWLPTDWFAKNTWCRAVIDLALLRNRAAALVDWKTGKMKEGYDQLKLTALMTFARYPDIDVADCMYVWLKDNQITRKKFHRDDEIELWEEFRPRVERMMEAFDFDNWPARQSGLCRKHCPVGRHNCIHCGE